MSKKKVNATVTVPKARIEGNEKEREKILGHCRAMIFRDIWRLTDADAALSMFFTLQRALPDGLDRSDTPTLNALASRLREAPDVLRYLEFSIKDPKITFPLLRFQEEHNRRAAEIRAAKAAEEAAVQPVEEEESAV